MNKALSLKKGDKIEFEILNPNWANPLTMKGVVGEVSNDFGGRIHIQKGAIAQDEFIIRLSSIKK